MALGRAQVQQGFQDPGQILGDRLREGSLYRLLADHGQVIFPDGYFADLYAESVRGTAGGPGPGDPGRQRHTHPQQPRPSRFP
jgi:hypothetical protein